MWTRNCNSKARSKRQRSPGTETPVRTVITIDYHIFRADDLNEVFTLKSEHEIPNDIALDVPDPEPDSGFVITAYDLGPKALKALRRRRRRKK